MRKIILTTFFIGALFELNAQDQLSNSGFESWQINVLAKRPTNWVSSYDEFGYFPSNPALVERSTDASNLSYSLKLNTVIIPGSTNPQFGFVLHGAIGESGPEGGVPFSISADSIIFDAKFDIQTGDSSNIYVILKSGGNPFDVNILRLGGTQSNWTRYAFKINPFNITPDSLILGFTSSETMNGGAAVGSWFMLDNIKFRDGATISSPIPNPSFESWSDISSEEADNWATYNSIYSAINFATVVKTTNSQTGTYAMELQPDSLSLGDTTILVPGFAAYGNMDLTNGSLFTGRPFVASPTALTGYYKWAPVNAAQGSINVIFQQAGVQIGGGTYEFTTAQSTYAQFTVPISVIGTPDTILVMIDAGQQAGSNLLIDNLIFSGGNVGVKHIALTDNTINVFPNPTNGDATLKVALTKSSNVSYVVMNALGQTMDSDNLGIIKDGVHSIKLNTGDYSTGVYFVKVKMGDNSMTQKVIIK